MEPLVHRTDEKDGVPEWRRTTVRTRIMQCRIMLYQHGLLTEAEMKRIDARIDKKFARK